MTLIVLGQPPIGGQPADSPLNSLITNDKFYLTRTGRLQLSWLLFGFEPRPRRLPNVSLSAA
jgi:hypothetical protein